MSAGVRLLADIGGTNARFATVAEGGAISAPTILPVADFSTFEAALAAFLAEADGPFAEAVVAAAGPVVDGAVQLTNADWSVSEAALRQATSDGRVRVFNDLEAVALALPYLGERDAMPVQAGQTPPTDAPRLAVNVGTGFGAAIALPDAGGWRAVPTEAGHMRFAAATPDERSIAHAVTTYEDLLSGRGFQRLRALILEPKRRRQAFSSLLGRVVGDVALATGAWGGIYLCGGVLEDWEQNVEVEPFLDWFLDKGPMAERLAATPVHRLTLPAPALLGLAHARLD